MVAICPLSSSFFTAVLVIYSTSAKVNLNTSAVRVCPGDTLVFTCITDTGSLTWDINGTNEVFYQAGQSSQSQDIFTLTLISVSGMMFVSTATAHNVSIEDDERAISCSDNNQIKKNVTIKLSDIPSQPLHVNITPHNGSVNISWVAPLDTPFCVHSYTVTVRNSCNSSQVMVYNTTDNRSSLSITDLTSDGGYSVTVAGRDEAGRLGQESRKISVKERKVRIMKNLSIENKVVFLGHNHNCGVLIHWNYSEMNFEYFLIKHNVSSDQSSITTNRPNVTLYGVQPGETYTVEIIVFLEMCTFYDVSQIHDVDCEKRDNTTAVHKKNCTRHVNNIKEDSTMPLGYAVSIASSFLLGVVILCYIVMCFCTSDYVQNMTTQSYLATGGQDDVNTACQQFQKDKGNCEKKDAQGGLNVNLLTYDYVRHQ